jgi:hypothetical protein
MIKTRKAILLSGTDKNKISISDRDPYHIVCDNIIAEMYKYLTSSVGGFWKPEEIMLIGYASKEDVLKNIKECKSDYIMFFFTGHGSVSNSMQLLNMNPKENIALNELTFCANKVLLILNCCRRINGEWQANDLVNLNFPNANFGEKNKDTSERFFSELNKDNGEMNQNSNCTTVYATSFNEIAMDKFFPFSLFNAAKMWYDTENSENVLTIKKLVYEAYQIMLGDDNVEYFQIPCIENPQDIPFAVKD